MNVKLIIVLYTLVLDGIDNRDTNFTIKPVHVAVSDIVL
jgi:hypothetical protein